MSAEDFAKKVAFSFARAFLGAFAVGVTGVLDAPNWEAGKAALVALVIASAVAGVRTVQVLFPGVDSHA